jgi:hypothetical protein
MWGREERGCAHTVTSGQWVLVWFWWWHFWAVCIPDELEEVAVMKNVLIQHLKLDSEVILGILCNQIVPPDEPMEEEGRVI